MRQLLVLIVCVAAALAAPAKDCDATCKRENGCVCASKSSPLPLKDTPQFVTLTVDDGYSAYVHASFYSNLLYNLKNPDDKPVSSTFYVPHEYTDYESVNSLYKKGFDIGVHSITKGSTDYWNNANQSQVVAEFKGQRELISKFANIPITAIKGVRAPHLIINGDTTIRGYVDAGLSYDNSWPTRSDQQLFPYTLQFKSSQIDPVGKRPLESYPNFWVLPINNFVGSETECNVLYGCQVSGTPEQIRQWLNVQFNRIYKDSKAPISILLSSVWLEQPDRENFNGLRLFLIDILKNKDVFLVSHEQVMNWAKNPVALKDYKTETTTKSAACTPITCPLKFGEFETRYMRSCVACPKVYPWVHDPLGQGK